MSEENKFADQKRRELEGLDLLGSPEEDTTSSWWKPLVVGFLVLCGLSLIAAAFLSL